ncbi:MAG: copper resistance protein CopC [Thermaceae bacterium]|nr:copper resistance protein CopC [Thermaceae bacterium]
MRRLSLWLWATLALTGAALAHAYLDRSSPAGWERVQSLPKEVRLVFTEPVELRLSTFKVYPLNVPKEALNDRTQLGALGGQLYAQVLGVKGDEAKRADTGVKTPGQSSDQVVIGLKDGLKPGAYVVMWRVLSVDTHITQDFFIFTYQP